MSQPSQAQLDIDAQILALKRQRNALAPVSRLLPEILGVIFEHSFPETLNPCKNLTSFLLDVAPIHVSQQWRAVARGHAKLWANVEIETAVCRPPRAGSEKALGFIWEHRRGVALNLTLAHYGPKTQIYTVEKFVVKAVRSDRNPLKSLKIVTNSATLPGLFSVTGSKASSFPGLEVLEIGWEVITRRGTRSEPNPQDLMSLFSAVRAPRLRRLTLCHSIPVRWNSSLLKSSLSSLTEITAKHGPTSGSYSELFLFLSSAPNLGIVNLVLSRGLDTEAADSTRDGSVALLKLRDLRLESTSLQNLVNFLSKIRVDKETFKILDVALKDGTREVHSEADLKELWSTIDRIFYRVPVAPAVLKLGENGVGAWKHLGDPRIPYSDVASIRVHPPALAGLGIPTGTALSILSLNRLRHLKLGVYAPTEAFKFFRRLALECPLLEKVVCTTPDVSRQFVRDFLEFCEGEEDSDRVPFPALRILLLTVSNSRKLWGDRQRAGNQLPEGLNGLDPSTLNQYSLAALHVGEALEERKRRLGSGPGSALSNLVVRPEYCDTEGLIDPQISPWLHNFSTKVSNSL